MIHPHTELRFINNHIGHGIIATQFIPKGTITWALDKLDRIFTPEQIGNMDKMYQEILDKYTYRNAEGNHVLCWDNARFVNHSSNSNCITTAYEFEIAIRDIHPGEELTDDYGYLNVETPLEIIPEEGSDRTMIYPDDLLRYYPVWDEKLLGAFPFIPQVEQPLLHLLTPAVRDKVMAIARGDQKMDSILNCYYRKGKHHNGIDRSEVTRSQKIAYPD